MMTGMLGAVFKVFGLIALGNRLLASLVLRFWKHALDATDDGFEPTVEVVVPMFNEGAGIEEAIASLLALEYPSTKLRITVVDDCSTDDSVAHALHAARFAQHRVRVLRSRRNVGKRAAIIRAVRSSDAEIIVSVDSDVVVDARAVRQLVRRFASPRIAAVGGHVDVRNKHDNWLTRMQAVRYWYSYNFGKALELACQQVMCLSGCLTAYRRHVLMEVEPALLRREVLGVPIKYGEDRFLTRTIVFAGYRSVMTGDAVCWTTVPRTLGAFQAQQLRWQRSGLIDCAAIMARPWRLHPIIAFQFFTLVVLSIGYPTLLVTSLLGGTFGALMLRKLVLLFVFGMFYRWSVRTAAPADRVSAFAVVPMAAMLPIIYGLLAVLALFTLDSSSWETRGHSRDLDRDDDPEREDDAPRRAAYGVRRATH